MDFYHRDTATHNGVAEGHRSVGVAARVEDHRGRSVSHRAVQRIDEHTLTVGLERPKLHAARLSPLLQALIDLSQRSSAVDLRLAAAEEVQVWTV